MLAAGIVNTALDVRILIRMRVYSGIDLPKKANVKLLHEIFNASRYFLSRASQLRSVMHAKRALHLIKKRQQFRRFSVWLYSNSLFN